MKHPPKISEAEWLVMEVLWQRHPITAGEVVEELAKQTEWAPNTVRTMLARLVRKGALEFDEVGNKYSYRPAFSRDRHVSNESESFLERIFGGTPKALLLHFAQHGRISRKDIAELRRILDEKRGPR